MLALLAFACSPSAPPPAPAADPGPPPVEEAAVILFVRHAEMGKDGTPDPPLTEAGEARARCLANQVRPANPTRLLTTEYKRTRATLAPTAEALGVEAQVIPADEDAQWTAALHEAKPGTVTLVAGHSNTVPALVAELGGAVLDLDEKGHIPGTEYDRFVTVTLDGQGRATSSVTTRYCVPPGEG